MPPRLSTAQAFLAAGEELQRIPGLLMGILQGREARAEREAARHDRERRLQLEEARQKLAETRFQAERDAEAARLTREREDRGIVGSRFSAVPEPDIERPELPAGPLGRLLTPGGGEAQASGIGLARGAEPGQTIRGRLTAMLGGTDLPRMPEHVLQPEHYDPTRDVELQRAEARARALAEIEREFATPEDAAVNWQIVQTDQGLVQVNPRTGETRPLGLQPPPRATAGAGASRPTEVQARIRVALPRAEEAMRQIEDFLGFDPETGEFAEEGGRVPVESFLGRVTPGRFLQPEDVQAYDRAAEAVASAILRVESGAAITRQEIESYKRQFIPQPGDRPEVIRNKLSALRSTLASMRAVAGLEGEPAAAPVEDLESNVPGEGLADRYSPDNPFAPGRSR